MRAFLFLGAILLAIVPAMAKDKRPEKGGWAVNSHGVKQFTYSAKRRAERVKNGEVLGCLRWRNKPDMSPDCVRARQGG
jgi:hypothetical protein